MSTGEERKPTNFPLPIIKASPMFNKMRIRVRQKYIN
jgi:hypothetical protein